MAGSSNHTDPTDGASPQERESTESEPTSASSPRALRDANVTDPDPRLFVPYGSATDNPRIRALFENMQTRRAPPPVDSPITNGELAAAYAAPSRAAPARNPTPVPQPAVMLAALTPVHGPPASPPVLRRPGLDAVTVRIDAPVPPPPKDRRARVTTIVLAGGALLTAIFFGIGWFQRRPEPPRPIVSTPFPAPTPRPTMTDVARSIPTVTLVPPATTTAPSATLPPADVSARRDVTKPTVDRPSPAKAPRPAPSSNDVSEWFE